MGRPADADKQTVRPVDPDLVEAPFAVTQDTAGTDNQVLHPRCNGGNVGRAKEDAKRIVLLRYAPEAGSRLGQVYLAAKSGQDNVIGGTPVRAKPRRSQNGIAAVRLLLGTMAKAPTLGVVDISSILHQGSTRNPAYPFTDTPVNVTTTCPRTGTPNTVAGLNTLASRFCSTLIFTRSSVGPSKIA